MEIFTGEQMRRVEQRAIHQFGVPSLTLMERAGEAVAEALRRDYPDLAERGALIICGKGNNGGDGLVAARYLVASGFHPRVLLLSRPDDLTPDAASQLAAARRAGVHVEEFPDAEAWHDGQPLAIPPGRIVVDALLGTGLRGGARGLAATVIQTINDSPGEVVAIDLPSGLDAESAAVPGPTVRAMRTYTLERPKLPLALRPSADFAGLWRALSIGIPQEAIDTEQAQLFWLDPATVQPLLSPRDVDTHKGDYGRLLVVAGSIGRSGAAVLAARGALRAGVGLVTVATPRSAQPLVAVQQAEVMTEPLAETALGALDAQAAGEIRQFASHSDALALGPGLGLDDRTITALREALRDTVCPVVVDADGLGALAPLGTLLPSALGPAGRQIVLTPHPGEAARLLDWATAEIQRDRLAAVREIARRSGAVAVLKGHRTLIAAPDGRAAVNASGNPGMATAGSGDVLTGVVGALLARGLSAWDAARIAVFAHGDAGDRAARARGQAGLIASDLVEYLPQALNDATESC